MDTKEITTPKGKHKVVLKTFITGRDDQAIQAEYFKESSVEYSGGEGKAGFGGSVIQNAQNKALEVVVVSVDGKENGVLDAVLDMHRDDTAFVFAEVDKVTGDQVDAKKN